MANVQINWTDKVWNLVKIAANEPRRTGAGHFAVDKLAEHFAVDKLAEPLGWRKPTRVLVDLFFEAFTNEQIAAVFGVMAATPQHTFQVLTKHARRMRTWFAWVATLVCDPWTECHAAALMLDDEDGTIHRKSGGLPARPWPLPNVHLGVSVEDQAAADERIPELLTTPAVVRFLSCEPLLGPVRLDDGESGWLTCSGPSTSDDEAQCCESRYVNGSCFHGIDWVIAGCGSGPGSRACDVAWLRSLRDQCAAGVPFFLKQAIEVAVGIVAPASSPPEIVRAVSPDRTRFTNMVIAGPGSKRKAGGVIELPYLDGFQHAAFPKVRR